VETTLDKYLDDDSDDERMSNGLSDSSTDDSNGEEQVNSFTHGLQNFTLDYMQRSLEYYDAIDPQYTLHMNY
jgi:hypothetical protein